MDTKEQQPFLRPLAGPLATSCGPRLLLLLVLLALPTALQAQEFTYATNDGTVSITGYAGPGRSVAGAILFFLLFGGVGGLFTWLGFSAMRSNRARRATWIQVEGSVVGLETRQGSKGTTLYAPVYRYCISGQEYTQVSDTASSPAAYKVGDPIHLLVDPDQRTTSMVLDNSTWMFSWGLLAVGLVTLAVGLLAGVLMLGLF
jgi:hypothetical protein